MTNNYPNYQLNQHQQQQQQPIAAMPMSMPQYAQMQPNIFLPPVGNLYSLNTASDINSVPAGANLSVGLCLSENQMYIKSFQNGAPMLLGYRLSPIEGVITSSGTAEENSTAGALKNYDERLDRIEEQLLKIKDKIGGKLEWQI